VTAPQELEVAIVGVARNCARSIERDLARLRQAATIFKRVHLLIVESDSDDGTPALLAQLARRMPQLRHLSLGALRPDIPERTARIAHCRNAGLDELASNPLYASVSHVLMSDLDGVSRDIDADAIASCWADGAPAWDMCAANQGDYYYDIWALRHETWCPGDAWSQHAALVPVLGRAAADDVALFSRMVHIDARRPMIEVRSAFGGLAIYRKEALLAARYVGLDDNGAEVCEHVTLHAQMRAQGARLYINPALINARRTKHAGRKKFWRTLRRRLWNTLRGARDE
jgi:glycosyltransferase involved in cell wall biosynthesis